MSKNLSLLQIPYKSVDCFIGNDRDGERRHRTHAPHTRWRQSRNDLSVAWHGQGKGGFWLV